jgi:hypothetical protein
MTQLLHPPISICCLLAVLSLVADSYDLALRVFNTQRNTRTIGDMELGAVSDCVYI